jgi:hypothetical protein
MLDDDTRTRLFHPRSLDELIEDPIPLTLLGNEAPEPTLPENVGVMVPKRQRSLHALVAQNLADTESLIARLEGGVGVADSGRGLIRDLYVQSRKQREILEAVLRLELE